MSTTKHRITACMIAACMMGVNAPMSAAFGSSLTVSAAEEKISEGLKLTQNTVIDGDLRLTGGTLDLNGYTLTIKGDFWHAGGILEVGSGTLKVNGSYQMRSSSSGYSSGDLRMTSEEGLVDVDGDLTIDTSVKSSDYQRNGVVRVGGNFACYAPNNGKGYTPRDTLVTEFKGDVVHEVTFNNAQSFLSTVRVTDGGSLLLKDRTRGFTLDSDAAFADGSQISGDRTLKLNGHTLTVTGDFRQAGDAGVNLDDSHMIVEGDYWHAGGILDVGIGTLHITGSYQMRSGSSSYSSGDLRMTSEDGLVDVDGDVVIDSSVESSDFQWNGVVRVGGNFACYAPNNGKGYTPRDTLVTEFKGDVVHEVAFNNAQSFLSTVRVTDGGSLLLKDRTRGFTLASDAAFADGSQIIGDRTLKLNGHTLTVTGDFRQAGDAGVNLDDSHMIVEGDYWHAGGILEVGSGTLKVGGSYQMRSGSSSYSSGDLRMTSEDGLVDVDGDAVIDSSVESSDFQWNGVVRVGGNFTCYAPNNGKGYTPRDALVTEFKGDVVHEVAFNNAQSFLSTVRVTDGGSLLLKDRTRGFTLDSDAAFADGSQISGDRTLKLNGHTLTVTGDFRQAGDAGVNLDGSNMLVAGDYWHAGGILDIGTGTLNITGSYQMRSSSSSYSSGDLRMASEDSRLITGGDVVIDTSVKSSDFQWNGVVSVGGNFTCYAPNNGRGYTPRDALVTEFRGGKAHTINFNNTGNSLSTIRIGAGDSITFSNQLPGISKDSSSAITVEPEELADVSKLTITGKTEGKGKVKFSNSSDSKTRTLIVGDSDTEPVFDGKTIPYNPPEATEPTQKPTEPTQKPTEPTQKPTEPTQKPTEPSDAKYLAGDVNLDGSVDIMDVIVINKYLLGASKLGETGKKNADVNRSNTVDASDSLLILKYVVEIIDTLDEPAKKGVDFTNVKITPMIQRVPANSNAAVRLNIAGDTDFTGSDAWLGLIPVGTGLSEKEADAVDISYTYLKDAYIKNEDNIKVGVFVPKGTAPGEYELRVYANDSGGDLVDRVTITVIEENTLKFDEDSLYWQPMKDDPSNAALMFEFTYTGEINSDSLIWIGRVPADAPTDLAQVRDIIRGVWAKSNKSAGGESGGFQPKYSTGEWDPRPYSGTWELRAYSDNCNGARLLDRVPIPAFTPDNNG